MEGITRVPEEFVKIIPVFNGDSSLLALFIKKTEYILRKFQGNENQMEYLYHLITSRLTGKAAILIGERDSIDSWDELKQLLTTHFGDPRPEKCLKLELEGLTKNRDESYVDFCHRIQQVRSVLFSKISETIHDEVARQSRRDIYNNTALETFLCSLPMHLVRLVHLRQVDTLEGALGIVMEEQNFENVYNSRNKHRLNGQGFQFNNNSNPPRQHFSQNFPSTSAPNNSFNPSNQFQFRNPRRFNNYSNNNQSNNFSHNNNFNNYSDTNNQPNNFTRNNQQSNYNSTNNTSYQSGSRTMPMQNQQYGVNAPRFLQNNQSPRDMPSSSNTDVTMRTANSRRINFTDNNNIDSDCYYDNPSCSYVNETNFSIPGPRIEKE